MGVPPLNRPSSLERLPKPEPGQAGALRDDAHALLAERQHDEAGGGSIVRVMESTDRLHGTKAGDLCLTSGLRSSGSVPDPSRTRTVSDRRDRVWTTFSSPAWPWSLASFWGCSSYGFSKYSIQTNRRGESLLALSA